MFDIELAGIIFRIENMYSEVETMCRDYYAGVVSKNETEQYADIQCNRRIKVTESDIKLERMKSESEDRKEGIQVRHFSDAYLETLAVYRKIAEQMIDYDTILFHGSVIAVDGEGYLFTAKSGTGKSTHTRLWRECFGDSAVMVNDDKPLLKITEEVVTAFGTPWDGKHRISNNIAVPLKAICVLNRDETNHIERVSGKDIYPLLLQQTYRSTDPVKMVQTLKLLDRMLKNMNFYSLGCNMNPEAAVVAYEGMQDLA